MNTDEHKMKPQTKKPLFPESLFIRANPWRIKGFEEFISQLHF